YGSIHRNQDYYELVKKYYPKNKVILIDGEDHQNFHHTCNDGFPYFKREMIAKYSENIYPINFAIPKEKFVENVNLPKLKDYATVIPGDLSTYIFNNEKDYYEDYQQSLFGITTKKAGWDCLRHYEIIANGCLPYFPGIEQCPFYTMYNFPKDKCKQVNELITDNFNQEVYKQLQLEIYNYAKGNLTTEALINYMFKAVKNDYNFGEEDDVTSIHPTIKREYERLCSPQEGQSVDIKEHLPTLRKYAQECEHITEMGVRSVVSTWAFLSGYPKKLVSYDIEYHPNIELALIAAKEAGIQFDYILKNVLKTEIEETDFLFLDTWHCFSQVSQELTLHANKVRKYIGFHDTISYRYHGEGNGLEGIWRAIQEFLNTHSEWKIKEEFENNNGLLIIERIKPLE
ncbi:MAG TPA: hypothetical protein VFV86_06450, partial [Nitrososphaeraceae archaeon]|nr:hypothetical protein [Nitrososphaeraceae archaeon]